MHRHLLATPMLIGTLAVAACGGSSPSASGSNSSTTSTSSGTTTAASTATAAACVSGSATASGSTALLPLVQKASTLYAAKCPGSSINVSGGGSSTGLSNVAGGTSDIGDSDVPASDATAINASTLVDHQVAIVMFAVVVNPKSGVTNLTLQQVRDVFSGKDTNWNQAGGSNVPITLIERTPGSGTRLTFDKTIMQGTAESTTPASTQDSTQLVVTGVAGAAGGVSYIAASSATSGVQVLTLAGVRPDASTISNGTYPFFAHEHMYTKGPGSVLAQSFIQYILSSDFQTGQVTALGFLPLSTTTEQSLADK